MPDVWQGQQEIRCADEIKEFAGITWPQLAEDRDAFALQWA